jgi:hypothetical protein
VFTTFHNHSRLANDKPYRHPNRKSTMAQNLLTDKALRALKPGAKETTHGDGGGLWIRVFPKDSGGAINFYYRFELANKERRFNCGTYPATTLAEARKRRDVARNLVKQGIDPVEKAKVDRAANTAAQILQQSEKTVQRIAFIRRPTNAESYGGGDGGG